MYDLKKKNRDKERDIQQIAWYNRRKNDFS